MATFKQKAFLKSYKRLIQKKLEDVVDDAENACAVIQELTLKLKRETETIIEENDEVFFTKYSKLQKELESLREKLFIGLNIITSSEECGKEEKPECLSLELPLTSTATYHSAGSNFESQKTSSSQVSDISPSTDSGICVKSHSNGLENSGKRSPTIVEQDAGSPPPLISEDEEPYSFVDVSTKNSSVDERNEQSSTAYACCDAFSSFGDRDQQTCALMSSSSESYDQAPKSSDEERCLFEMSAASVQSFASAKSNLDSSYKSVIESDDPDLLSQDVFLGTTVTAPVTVFHNPSDFWVQLENPVMEDILKTSKFRRIQPVDVRKTKYCIVPSEHTDSYQRAKVLSMTGSGANMQAEVMFIDSGDLEIVPVADMQEMPKSLYEYPPQAVHCFLHGVVPVENMWTEAAVQLFEQIRFCTDVQITVLHKQDDMYAVQLTVIFHELNGTESLDFAQMLCLTKLAIPVSLSQDPLNSTSSSADGINKQGFPSPSDVKRESCALNPNAKEFISEACLSDVLTANAEASNSHNDSILTEHITKNLESLDVNDIYMSDEESNHEDTSNQISCTNDYMDSNHVPEPVGNMVPSEISETCVMPEWDLDVVLPSPCPFLVDDDMMIVIPSVIYSPSYFYCNVAMNNSLELDELRDMMTNTYSNLDDCMNLELSIDKIKAKMYLACSFDDGYWYRVQVDYICDAETGSCQPKIVVTFVDYGNEKMVDITDLRPLKTQFANYPIMGILCSLAYIKPKSQDVISDSVKDSPIKMKWGKSSTDRFHELTKNEKVFTAQMSQFRNLSDKRVMYEVFLWDTGEKGDRMINDMLVEEGLAEYNNAGIIPNLLKPVSKKEQPVDAPVLDVWDPMQDHFEDVLNSYGVDERDAEISTVGYKAKDESYICKYFSMNGYCHRGERCTYQHIPQGYRDETIDREEVYAFDNEIVLPNEGIHCLVQVSCIITAGHFYVVFPFGTTPVSETLKTSGLPTPSESEFQQLTSAMNRHYSKSAFAENTAIALACGTIVAAKSKFDGTWYRARIKEVEDLELPLEVFYVDFGATEWVDRRNIREMLPEFTHCPFQAVEAFLANVDPPRGRDGPKWTNKSISAFENHVKGKTLLAYVNRKIGSVLFLTLKLTYLDNHVDVINSLLIQEGYARFSSQNSMSSTSANISPDTGSERMVIGPG